MGLQGGGASLASIAGNDWVMSMAGIGALSVQSRDGASGISVEQ